MLSTDLLAAFVSVAEHLSVSAAARELGVGKSSAKVSSASASRSLSHGWARHR
ncbi:MAG: LysR family transcriptional regulator [Rhodopila sp.]|jgi:DNA-binding transcriptional LysR family regulator